MGEDGEGGVGGGDEALLKFEVGFEAREDEAAAVMLREVSER